MKYIGTFLRISRRLTVFLILRRFWSIDSNRTIGIITCCFFIEIFFFSWQRIIIKCSLLYLIHQLDFFSSIKFKIFWQITSSSIIYFWIYEIFTILRLRCLYIKFILAIKFLCFNLWFNTLKPLILDQHFRFLLHTNNLLNNLLLPFM